MCWDKDLGSVWDIPVATDLATSATVYRDYLGYWRQIPF